jgi:hypothetical protein
MSDGVQIEISKDMIEQVMREWESEHPGCLVIDMSPDEFADRMMKKIMASAKIVQVGDA